MTEENKKEIKEEGVENESNLNESEATTPEALEVKDFSKMSLEELAKARPDLADELTKKQELEARIEELQKSFEEAEKREAEKAGDFQKLYQQELSNKESLASKLKEKEDILKKYDGTLTETVDNLLKDIPEENRQLIPDDFSPRQKLSYITKNANLLRGSSSKNIGGPVPKNDENNLSAEQRLMAEISELQKKENKTQSEHTLIWEKSKALKELRNSK